MNPSFSYPVKPELLVNLISVGPTSLLAAQRSELKTCTIA